jgi:hypothetical protein
MNSWKLMKQQLMKQRRAAGERRTTAFLPYNHTFGIGGTDCLVLLRGRLFSLIALAG